LCSLGGSYDFTHCTFNNNFQSSSQTAVSVNNYYLNDANQQVPFDLIKADFKNCIIYGSNQVEMVLRKAEDSSFGFNYSFDGCLIKFNNTTLQNTGLYKFDEAPYANIKLNLNPRFWDINKNNLHVTTESGAVGAANPLYLFSPDLDGNPRTSSNDAGAYQSADVPDAN